MKRRALRLALATLIVGVFGGAAYLTWIAESQSQERSASARHFDDQARVLTHALLEIKSAQPGYVAVGQGHDYWTAKIDRLLPPARDGVASLRTYARTGQAQSGIETSSAALEDFEQLDRRAREYTRSGQRLLASDLVFSDGIEKLEAAVAALDRAREAERVDTEIALAQYRLKRWLAFGGAATFSLVSLLILLPGPRQAPADAPVEEPQPDEPARELSIAPRTTRILPAKDHAAAPAAAPRAITVPPTTLPAAAPTVDLPSVASICSELARVVDTRALPAALERAAKVLQASGIILWIADPDGRELVPVVAHGYPQHLVNRLGNIARDAENVTAAAFRTGLLQTVKSDAVSPGAIAAPLLAPTGPIGVMAAEVLNERERHDQTLAAATIVAAQLATLMAPPVRTQTKAEAMG